MGMSGVGDMVSRVGMGLGLQRQVGMGLRLSHSWECGGNGERHGFGHRHEAQGFCWCGTLSQLQFSWGDSRDPLLRLWFWEKRHGSGMFLGVSVP